MAWTFWEKHDNGSMMIYTKTVTSDLETVKREMADRAKEHGFGILKEYDFNPPLLKEKGFPIEHEITVFELCNPKAAQEALTLHQEIAVYLPCRIAVYVENGKTVISTIGIEEILGSFELEESFKAKMNRIFDDIKALIESWE
jgi:uncharacterized protein (DUF302 family)